MIQTIKVVETSAIFRGGRHNGPSEKEKTTGTKTGEMIIYLNICDMGMEVLIHDGNYEVEKSTCEEIEDMLCFNHWYLKSKPSPGI
ncbi:hypothetical protein PTKIN_Ptkin09bG0236200 [Pterospermum kingtungense]